MIRSSALRRRRDFSGEVSTYSRIPQYPGLLVSRLPYGRGLFRLLGVAYMEYRGVRAFVFDFFGDSRPDVVMCKRSKRMR